MEKTIKEEQDQIQQLLSKIPKEQIRAVFDQDFCDISGEFVGFLDQYEKLSELIPKHFTVIDFGCAYNPQCFYFTEHKKYVAVDASECIKFKAPNCQIFNETIEDFITKYLKDFYLDETFAICNYVPPWYGGSGDFVRKAFKNVFVFYPHGGTPTIDIKK